MCPVGVRTSHSTQALETGAMRFCYMNPKKCDLRTLILRIVATFITLS
jgi:hypothetical protein